MVSPPAASGTIWSKTMRAPEILIGVRQYPHRKPDCFETLRRKEAEIRFAFIRARIAQREKEWDSRAT